MISDLPHTLYKDKKKVSKADIDDAARKTLELMEKKKKAQTEGQMTITELFNSKD